MRLTPLTNHDLAVLFVQLAALLAAARLLGGLARRVGQPSVVGELLAGLILGPSVFGKVWTGGFNWFLPAHQPVENGGLLTISQVSLVVLLVVIGAETDLPLIRRLGRAATSVSAFSLAVPFGAGLALAAVLPHELMGTKGTHTAFLLLIAGAVSVSSLPVIAKIVTDLGLARRNVGQLILAAGAANDTFGFLVVAAATALVGASGSSSTFHLLRVAGTLIALGLGIIIIGQRLLDGRFRQLLSAESAAPGEGATGQNLATGLSLCLLGAFTVTALFQAAGIEGALGAFLLGILVGRSRYRPEGTMRAITAMSSAVFAPLYFATAGLRVDVSTLGHASALWAFGALVVVATLAKVAGTVIGGAIGKLPGREWLALSAGLNGRGALQVIIGSTGLTIGALSSVGFTEIILMSIVTSVLTAPALRAAAHDWEGTKDEQERLDFEGEMARNVVVRGQRLLLPSRGSVNSILAAEVLAAAWPEASEVTLISIGEDEEGNPPDLSAAAAVLAPREVEIRHVASDEVLEEILAEAKLGYGVIGLGAAESPVSGRLISPVVDDLLARSNIPMVVVRRARQVEGRLPPAFSRLLAPVTGSASSRAGLEVAFNISRQLGTDVTLAHVVTRSSRARVAPAGRSAAGAGSGILEGAEAEGQALGLSRVRSVTRKGPSAAEEILAAAEEAQADLVVMGSTVRLVDQRPFLGHTVEHILEHAAATVVVVVLPVPPAPSEVVGTDQA
ncbi:MAG: cation:proton antiporter domain-containing protein [Acidimicrobiales bacterium]